MRQRLQQMLAAWRATREADPQAVLWVGGGALLGFLVGFVPWLVLGRPVLASLFGLLLLLLGGLVTFGRRAQRAQISSIEGQPGAAAAVLQVMRGQWFVTPAVAFNRKQDLVHRVTGRCGVVLVGEGNVAGVKQLLAQEKKRLARLVGDAPVHTVVVGEREGQVALGKLQMHVSKLPGKLKKTEVPKLERRLAAMDPGLPMPKGAMPRPGKKQR